MMARWILRGVVAAAVAIVAASGGTACTGDDPNLTPAGGADASGDGGIGTDDDGGPAGDATNLADRDVDSSTPGTRRACEGTPRLAATTGDRVLFEPYGILVDGTGALVGWEDSITKRVAVPVDAARRAKVTGCCLDIGVGGGLVYAHGPELNVGTGDFSVYTQIKRNGALPSEASGGSAILKKPGASFPFIGYALFLGHRDPADGIQDLPSFQLQYDPQISIESTTNAVPSGSFLVVAGSRQGSMLLRVGADGPSRARSTSDALDLDNSEPLYLGGGGDNHFNGQLCAMVLNVGGEAAFAERASAIGALAH